MMDYKVGPVAAMLICFKNMPRIRQTTSALIFAMLVFSLVGLAVDDANKSLFSIIYFVAPLAWMLWIWCSLQARKERVGLTLVLLWVMIDLSILITLFSLTVSRIEADQSLGADMVILVAYFPVLFPIAFFQSLIPHGLSLNGVFDSQTTIGALMRMWSEPTIWAAAQSFSIYWLGRISWRPKSS